MTIEVTLRANVEVPDGTDLSKLNITFDENGEAVLLDENQKIIFAIIDETGWIDSYKAL